MGKHTAHAVSHAVYAHILFPRSRLGALIFPKVSSCGPCARLSGELWRGWRRLACWMEQPVTCAFCSTATSLSSAPLLHLPSRFSSRGGLPAETGRLILPCLPPRLYPSDKALCISSSPRLLDVSHSVRL